MSLMKLLEQAGGGQGLAQLASQFGLDESKVSELSGLLAPAIGSAAKQQATSGGLGDLLGSLKGEGQGALFDDPAQAASPEGQAQGMAFLENLMGGSEGAQGLAETAAEKAGVDVGTVMQFMPAIAGMLQGGLQKQLPDSDVENLMPSGAGGIGGMISGLLGGGGSAPDLSMLTNLLDADGDGSILDDIMGKFMK